MFRVRSVLVRRSSERLRRVARACIASKPHQTAPPSARWTAGREAQPRPQPSLIPRRGPCRSPDKSQSKVSFPCVGKSRWHSTAWENRDACLAAFKTLAQPAYVSVAGFQCEPGARYRPPETILYADRHSDCIWVDGGGRRTVYSSSHTARLDIAVKIPLH